MQIMERANKGKLNLTFHGRRDHLDPELREYKARCASCLGLFGIELARVLSGVHTISLVRPLLTKCGSKPLGQVLESKTCCWLVARLSVCKPLACKPDSSLAVEELTSLPLASCRCSALLAAAICFALKSLC